MQDLPKILAAGASGQFAGLVIPALAARGAVVRDEGRRQFRRCPCKGRLTRKLNIDGAKRMLRGAAKDTA